MAARARLKVVKVVQVLPVRSQAMAMGTVMAPKQAMARWAALATAALRPTAVQVKTARDSLQVNPVNPVNPINHRGAAVWRTRTVRMQLCPRVTRAGSAPSV